jgi:6-phosphogluconolactonase
VQSVEIRRAVNAQDVAAQASLEITESIKQLLLKPGVVNVALTGGTVGIKTLEALAENDEFQGLDFTRVHFWWGDERYVAEDSVDRNANQAKDAMLSKIKVPAENIHEFPSSDAGLAVADAAVAFNLELSGYFTEGKPTMDITIMGMGPDGHVASLFPGHSHGIVDVVSESDSPKPPSERLSFSYGMLNRSKKMIFVVSGIDKAEAVEQVHTNEVCDLPAAKVSAAGETIWFIDEAAGAAFWSC